METRHFITVDRCSKESRGVFCNREGQAYSKDRPWTEDEMGEVLGVFEIVLAPMSMELTEEELAEYRWWSPLAEYSYQFGIARKEKSKDA